MGRSGGSEKRKTLKNRPMSLCLDDHFILRVLSLHLETETGDTDGLFLVGDRVDTVVLGPSQGRTRRTLGYSKFT